VLRGDLDHHHVAGPGRIFGFVDFETRAGPAAKVASPFQRNLLAVRTLQHQSRLFCQDRRFERDFERLEVGSIGDAAGETQSREFATNVLCRLLPAGRAGSPAFEFLGGQIADVFGDAGDAGRFRRKCSRSTADQQQNQQADDVLGPSRHETRDRGHVEVSHDGLFSLGRGAVSSPPAIIRCPRLPRCNRCRFYGIAWSPASNAACRLRGVIALSGS
jgi:hypothetical protein